MTHDRRGIALLIALVALLVIGALVSATLLRVQSDVRVSREGMARRRAEAAAERVLRVALSSTSSASVRALPIGASLTSTDATDGITTSLVIVRVDTALAWLDATSTVPAVRGSARARLGVSAVVASVGTTSLQIVGGDAWTPLFDAVPHPIVTHRAGIVTPVSPSVFQTGCGKLRPCVGRDVCRRPVVLTCDTGCRSGVSPEPGYGAAWRCSVARRQRSVSTSAPGSSRSRSSTTPRESRSSVKAAVAPLLADAIVEGEVMDPRHRRRGDQAALAAAGVKTKKVVTAVGGRDVIIKRIQIERVKEAAGARADALGSRAARAVRHGVGGAGLPDPRSRRRGPAR